MKLALAQINTKAGDIDGNLALAIQFAKTAEAAEADLVVFPELAITGYPPEDLLFRKTFIDAAERAVEKFARSTGIAAIIGSPFAWPRSKPFNAAAFCNDGRVQGWYFKHHLPNYAVFDEARYFIQGSSLGVFTVKGTKIGISICEDIWQTPRPTREQVRNGAELLINISASPFESQRHIVREKIVTSIVETEHVPMAYCNLVGGQDELVFDGGSFSCSSEGTVTARAPSFSEDLLIVDLSDTVTRSELRPLGPIEETFEALVLGTRDYVHKNGFEHVVLGLSGGIDSALVATIAAYALQPENVTGVLMPSRYSSSGSETDAEALVTNLGINAIRYPISEIHAAYETLLAPQFEGTQSGVAEENIQARIRGNLIMALANKFGWMVLTTGNKSEMAMGYATLYGDMAGGYAVIKDVPKTLVFEMCRWLNRDKIVIPQSIIDKPPSAELRPDQKDTDSLPPYETLDPIIDLYVEEGFSAGEIIAAGHDAELVHRVTSRIDLNEYKRRQAPPGPRVTSRAFGKDRRLPITNGWIER